MTHIDWRIAYTEIESIKCETFSSDISAYRKNQLDNIQACTLQNKYEMPTCDEILIVDNKIISYQQWWAIRIWVRLCYKASSFQIKNCLKMEVVLWKELYFSCSLCGLLLLIEKKWKRSTPNSKRVQNCNVVLQMERYSLFAFYI